MFAPAATPYGFGALGGVPRAPVPQFGAPMPSFSSTITPAPAVSMVPAAAPAPAPAPAVKLPDPPKVTEKLSVTPDRVEKLLEQAYARLETLGNQLRAAASELEEIRAEILTANNLCDSELRSQLQQANDEIYKLRNSLAECAERKVNKMDKKDLMDI
eukprot:CAMPEP_0174281854 /NCGR_PEP_ID=MMETSP0809-20121228/2275_1 /TAXON_ID=73025 ORGANISM="Eutreptiella gymnastica-like, Strain CCMP1594" /NCGR_SAMPLE_ID=MMETSP0809 /ASSEMBLY_ACC=CAM_ASM_000658 /LENGTH=157 /DNA_ID=CAMNT_0015375681 /DNA_START=31 /DNA_END=504 /DNA_ORIENTATION=-